MSYYIDSGSTAAGTSLSLAAADRANFEGGMFYQQDFEAFKMVGRDLIAIPGALAGYAAADLAGHPGLLTLNSTAVSSVTYATNAIANSGVISSWYPIHPIGQTSLKMIFKLPAVASNATNRYISRIGMMYASVATIGSLPSGWYLEYTDTVNGGNWVFAEDFNNARTLTSNTSIPFVANTWLRLEINVTNANIDVTLTPSGTTNTQTVFSGLSPTLNAGTTMAICPAGIYMNRTISTGTVYGTVVDYCSITVGPTGRQY